MKIRKLILPIACAVTLVLAGCSASSSGSVKGTVREREVDMCDTSASTVAYTVSLAGKHRSGSNGSRKSGTKTTKKGPSSTSRHGLVPHSKKHKKKRKSCHTEWELKIATKGGVEEQDVTEAEFGRCDVDMPYPACKKG